MKVDILETNPSRLALKLADGNIRFITDLNAEMGLKPICNCKGSHAIVFRKESGSGFDWGKIRYFEKLSKALHTPLYPIYEIVRFGLRTARKVFS
jgi:hypothetical protein